MATHGQQQFILNEKLFSRKDAKAQRKAILMPPTI
jgi:hypothetical protein